MTKRHTHKCENGHRLIMNQPDDLTPDLSSTARRVLGAAVDYAEKSNEYKRACTRLAATIRRGGAPARAAQLLHVDAVRNLRQAKHALALAAENYRAAMRPPTGEEEMI